MLPRNMDNNQLFQKLTRLKATLDRGQPISQNQLELFLNIDPYDFRYASELFVVERSESQRRYIIRKKQLKIGLDKNNMTYADKYRELEVRIENLANSIDTTQTQPVNNTPNTNANQKNETSQKPNPPTQRRHKIFSYVSADGRNITLHNPLDPLPPVTSTPQPSFVVKHNENSDTPGKEVFHFVSEVPKAIHKKVHSYFDDYAIHERTDPLVRTGPDWHLRNTASMMHPYTDFTGVPFFNFHMLRGTPATDIEIIIHPDIFDKVKSVFNRLNAQMNIHYFIAFDSHYITASELEFAAKHLPNNYREIHFGSGSADDITPPVIYGEQVLTRQQTLWLLGTHFYFGRDNIEAGAVVDFTNERERMHQWANKHLDNPLAYQTIMHHTYFRNFLLRNVQYVLYHALLRRHKLLKNQQALMSDSPLLNNYQALPMAAVTQSLKRIALPLAVRVFKETPCLQRRDLVASGRISDDSSYSIESELYSELPEPLKPKYIALEKNKDKPWFLYIVKSLSTKESFDAFHHLLHKILWCDIMETCLYPGEDIQKMYKRHSRTILDTRKTIRPVSDKLGVDLIDLFVDFYSCVSVEFKPHPRGIINDEEAAILRKVYITACAEFIDELHFEQRMCDDIQAELNQ